MILQVAFMAVVSLIMVAFAYMFMRLNRVYNFRMSLIDQIHEAAKADRSKEYMWRWKEYDKVLFDDMMIHFWKPLKAEVWWEDTKFLEP